MKLTHLASAIAVSLFGGLCALPALAATSDDIRPPEIGLVQPSHFSVNHLTTIQTTVTSEAGLSGCYLFLNSKNVGRMDIRDGHASMQRVFDTPETQYASVRCEDGAGTVGMGATIAMLADRGDEPTQGYLPSGFSEGQLVQPTCLPGDWQGDYCSVVYQIQNGQRHPFQSNAAFLSWYPISQHILSVSVEALSTVPLGKMISMKPGTGNVRFLSQGQVYQVLGPTRLHKTTSDMKDPIDVLTDAFFSQFSIDPEMNQTAGTAA